MLTATCGNVAESEWDIPRVERFGDGDIAVMGNYGSFAGLAYEQINNTSCLCDERNVLTYVLIHLDREGNGMEWTPFLRQPVNP